MWTNLGLFRIKCANPHMWEVESLKAEGRQPLQRLCAPFQYVGGDGQLLLPVAQCLVLNAPSAWSVSVVIVRVAQCAGTTLSSLR